jgi:hypothetical protein
MATEAGDYSFGNGMLREPGINCQPMTCCGTTSGSWLTIDFNRATPAASGLTGSEQRVMLRVFGNLVTTQFQDFFDGYPRLHFEAATIEFN